MVSVPAHGYRRTATPSSTTTHIVLIAAIIVLGIYCWSLSSENKSLRNTMLHTYTRLRQVANVKVNLEKRNTVLSNRMVEMEEQRDTAKETKDQEKSSREHCEKLLSSKEQQLEDAHIRLKKIMEEVYPDKKTAAPDEEQKLTQQSEEDFETTIQKIRELKVSLTSVQQDYMLLQNKYTNLDKEFVEMRRQKKECQEKEKASSIAEHSKKILSETSEVATTPDQEAKTLHAANLSPTKHLRRAKTRKHENSLVKLKQRNSKALKSKSKRKVNAAQRREVSSLSPSLESTIPAKVEVTTVDAKLTSTASSDSSKNENPVPSLETPKETLQRVDLLRKVEARKSEQLEKGYEDTTGYGKDEEENDELPSTLPPLSKEQRTNDEENATDTNVAESREDDHDNKTA